MLKNNDCVNYHNQSISVGESITVKKTTYIASQYIDQSSLRNVSMSNDSSIDPHDEKLAQEEERLKQSMEEHSKLLRDKLMLDEQIKLMEQDLLNEST